MRYALIGVGLLGIILGILIDLDKGGVLGLQIGPGCLAIGLATYDISVTQVGATGTLNRW